jgi:Bacterial mobilisation protein (MobC)
LPLEPQDACALQRCRMARPTKKEKRDRQLNIKLTLREIDTVRARASAAGMRPVDYGRAQLLADKPAQSAASAAAPHLDTLFLVQLSRIGNNLNQIARKFNLTGAHPPAALEQLLAEIRGFIRKGSENGP